VYKGRPDNAIGAHCQGCNTNTLRISFEVNYDNRTEMPIEQCNQLKKTLGIWFYNIEQ
jgi:N-acetylmuramoyl-L-alanine amidase